MQQVEVYTARELRNVSEYAFRRALSNWQVERAEQWELMGKNTPETEELLTTVCGWVGSKFVKVNYDSIFGVRVCTSANEEDLAEIALTAGWLNTLRTARIHLKESPHGLAGVLLENMPSPRPSRKRADNARTWFDWLHQAAEEWQPMEFEWFRSENQFVDDLRFVYTVGGQELAAALVLEAS